MTTKGENHYIVMHFIIKISAFNRLHVDADKTERPAYPYSATDVARCRGGDVSRVSLKYDAAECSPGLLSMEWYPSLIVPGHRRMFTSVGEHGMVPLLVPGVFLPVVFSMQATGRVLQRHMAPSLHFLLFLWKTFLLPLYIFIH